MHFIYGFEAKHPLFQVLWGQPGLEMLLGAVSNLIDEPDLGKPILSDLRALKLVL